MPRTPLTRPPVDYARWCCQNRVGQCAARLAHLS